MTPLLVLALVAFAEASEKPPDPVPLLVADIKDPLKGQYYEWIDYYSPEE